VARPSIATINLSAISHNFSLLKDYAGTSKIIAVVKADAYGNGAVKVAQILQNKADMFAVAFVEEALELREAGITLPILILQGAHKAEDFNEGLGLNLVWLFHERWQLAAYKDFVEKYESAPAVWLKFDSGMHRLGFALDEFSAILTEYASLINHNTVIVTHLACADEPIKTHAQAQIERFMKKIDESSLPRCIANSATNIRFEKARQDYVRLGIALYGSTPFQSSDNPIELAPVMSVNSEIIALRHIPKGDTVGYGGTWRALRPSVIATVAIGYADGYPRHAPTGTPAWCNGQLIPLVGRVSMDMLTFDVTDLFEDDSCQYETKIGDKVQLWGDQLPINQVAEHIGTIGYELMTRVSKRIPRKYI
jgi:alanine racemase